MDRNSGTGEWQAVEPVGVVLEESSGKLLVDWSDGLQTQYPVVWLRWQCPCALCKGEMGVPGRLSQIKDLRTDETMLTDVQPVGRYGLMLYWADGHHDGIYTYDWLRANSQDADTPEPTSGS